MLQRTNNYYLNGQAARTFGLIFFGLSFFLPLPSQ
jgi:hypothetical protein